MRAGAVATESFGEQEPVGSDAQAGVVMKAAPAAAFIVVETELLLELLVIALDAPALMGALDQFFEGSVLGQRRQVVLLRLCRRDGPLDQQPLARPQARATVVTAGMAYPHRGEAAAQALVGAFAPVHGVKGVRRQGLRQRPLTVTGWRLAVRRGCTGGRPRP